MKTFKDLKEWDTVWIIDYKDIKEYKVHYCIPYNDHHCLVIKDFSTSKGYPNLLSEHPVDSDRSVVYIDKHYIVLNKEDIHEYQMKCLIKRRNKLYGLLNGLRKAERTYINQIDEVENLINKCNE